MPKRMKASHIWAVIFHAAPESVHFPTKNDTKSGNKNQQLLKDAFHFQDAITYLLVEQQVEE